MRFLWTLAVVLLVTMGPQADAEEQLPPCIPLYETLSICTDIEGLGVSFVGATETSAVGTVASYPEEGTYFVWAVVWDEETSFEQYAGEELHGLTEQEPEYELQNPVSVVVEGFPSVRYDLHPMSGGGQELPPKLLLFLDLGKGAATLYGTAQKPGVSKEDLFQGARKAARILNLAE